MPTSPAAIPTPVSDWLARRPVVDLRLWRDVRQCEHGLAGDPAAAIAWLEKHGHTLSDRLIDAGLTRRRAARRPARRKVAERGLSDATRR
jgi:hypothetical protein